MDKNILDAAQSLLAEVGDSFTMAQLEAKANTSRATIYRRVGNKAKLLEHLAQARGEPFEKADSRLNILKAARTVFGRTGLAAATMEQIAAEAKVGVATVYRYFGDKESLVQAFIEEMTPRTAVRSIALNPTEDVAADLAEIVHPTLIFFFENRDILRLVFMGGETERRYFERMRQRSDSTLSRLTTYFQSQLDARRLQALGAADDLALALIGMVLAFAVIGPLHYDTEYEHPEATSTFIVTLFLNNLRANN